MDTAKEYGLEGDYVIFLILAYTGIRAGELCALKWRDINFTEHTISFTKTYYNPTNNTKEYHILPPKTKTSKRVIDVEDIVINELERLRVNRTPLRCDTVRATMIMILYSLNPMKRMQATRSTSSKFNTEWLGC
ncbi:tyrosine-type recombinase/integrase [Paenibacillus lupini]|uniref:tyrosine-type recombinase/integrase n=1 Tax=Paenibacillus lupini TaxID=1450204 RepID=UPI001FBA3A6C|nr:hypothetical protein [Paenibacillus lupini]